MANGGMVGTSLGGGQPYRIPVAKSDMIYASLGEELGLRGLTLSPRPGLEYRADVGGGMVEHEVVSLFVATGPAPLVPRPDAAEVMAVRWVTPEALRAEAAAAPERFTPWLRIYLAEQSDSLFAS